MATAPNVLVAKARCENLMPAQQHSPKRYRFIMSILMVPGLRKKTTCLT